MCITLFCTVLCCHCTTTMWKYLISRCTEKVPKRRRNFPSLCELGYSSSEFNFKRVCLNLTKLGTWSNRDEDWKNANSLFQRQFSLPAPSSDLKVPNVGQTWDGEVYLTLIIFNTLSGKRVTPPSPPTSWPSAKYTHIKWLTCYSH